MPSSHPSRLVPALLLGAALAACADDPTAPNAAPDAGAAPARAPALSLAGSGVPVARAVVVFRDTAAIPRDSMGAAIPLALGIALTRPERHVVVLEGDGSLLMSPNVLATGAAAYIVS